MSLLPEINQASAEINKFVAQANIHQTIAPVNPAEFTSPADTLLLASRDPVIREVSVGMTGEAYSEYFVSGTPPLSLPNSLGKPLKAWNVALSPYQDLHGYDNPWPAGGGKNKFDYSAYQPLKIESGITFTVNTDGTVKANGTATGQSQIYWKIPQDVAVTWAGYVLDVFQSEVSGVTAMLEEAGGSYTQYVVQTGGTGETISSSIADVERDVNFIIRVTSGTTLNNVVFYPMIRLANSTHDFAPYSNICPILGTDKLNLFVEESYDPSATPKAVLTLPQTVYTGTIGSEGGESRMVEADMGSFNWTYYNSNYFHTDVIADAKAGVNNVVTSAMCEVYKPTAPNDIQEGTINVSTGRRIVVKDSNYSDAATFKTAVTGKKVVYELETPTTFAVPSVTIPTPTGTATTWATAENGTVDSMKVTYYKSE